MSSTLGNVMMVSADRWVVAGDKGPFHYMLERFSRHWDRVDVIGTRPDKIEQTQVFDNVHLHHPTTGKLKQAAYIERTGRALAAERDYTVITSHDYNPFYNGWGSWRVSRATGIPYVSEIHHVPGFPRAANLRERVDRVLTKRYVRWALWKAAAFRVVNHVELPDLLSRWGVPRERIAVLPSLYMDFGSFRPADEMPWRATFAIVGRLVANKGILQTVEALARVRERGHDASLVILGRGPLAGEIDATIAKRGLTGHVERIEWVEDSDALAELYRSVHALVCASTSEGGPRVVAEAMACGTPVISTRVGVVPELIDPGRNGLIYDGTTDGLAAAMTRLVTDHELETHMRSELPGDLSHLERDRVIEGLATGLKEIAAKHRARA